MNTPVSTNMLGKTVSCRLGIGEVIAVYLDRNHVLTFQVAPLGEGQTFSIWAQECRVE